MHAVSPETRELVDLVLDYSRRRILSEDTPLDKPLRRVRAAPARRARRSPRTASAPSARSRCSSTCSRPACITTDHPQLPVVHPDGADQGGHAFDLVVSASAVYGGSWLEGSGAVYAENEVLALAGRPSSGCPRPPGGVFVQGGTLGNLSALVAAREARAATERGEPARPLGDRLQRRGALVDRVGRRG